MSEKIILYEVKIKDKKTGFVKTVKVHAGEDESVFSEFTYTTKIAFRDAGIDIKLKKFNCSEYSLCAKKISEHGYTAC